MSAPLFYVFKDKAGNQMGQGMSQMRYWIPPRGEQLALEGLNALFELASKADKGLANRDKLKEIATVSFGGEPVTLDDIRSFVAKGHKDAGFNAQIQERAKVVNKYIPLIAG